MIVSDYAFGWVVTMCTVVVAVAWLYVDFRRLSQALREDRRDPVVRDRIFGAFIGFGICLSGVIGVIAYRMGVTI